MLPRGLKIPPKSTQNRPKIAPWSILGPPSGTKILFFRLGIDFGAQFGAPWDPKSTKNRYFARKMLQEARFQSNVRLARCITSFFIPFLVIFGQKNDEKNITLLCFLLVCPTLEKPCILQATLHGDSVFAIMLKYWKSNKKTMKKHEKWKC